ncbi:methyltransferase domain-containing protein [Desulfobacula sp.]|uniref:class I SAM-dependent methyltransferase n=1 Tax=Desulfobacula sp. TaxID=2593537 RepID=UPI00260E27A2|nr:methyltransferase domain-containing protein [Desulfobacula sp.]
MNDFNVFIDDLPLWSAPFGLKLLDTLIFKKNINVLDIGCGEGFPLIEIAARFGGTSRFFGLEPLASPLERLVFKKQAYHLPTVHPVQGLAETLPFDDQCFHLIVSNNGVNNVRDLNQTLTECQRVIKPRGQMVIAMNTRHTMKEFYALFETILVKESLGTAVEKMKDQIRQKRLPRKELVVLLNAAGFRIHQILDDAFTLKFTDGTTLFNHYLIRHFFLNGWKQLVDSNKINTVFDQIETRLNNRATKKGHIRLTIPYRIIDCRAK